MLKTLTEQEKAICESQASQPREERRADSDWSPGTRNMMGGFPLLRKGLPMPKTSLASEGEPRA